MEEKLRSFVVVLAFGLACAGCASYPVPGASVSLAPLAGTDIDPSARKPSPRFPLRMAIVRVQAPQYRSLSTAGYGHGRFSVLSRQEPLNDQALKTVADWPSISAVVPVDTEDISADSDGFGELRLAAAKVQADLLLAYTVDTTFNVNGKSYGAGASIPLSGEAGAQSYVGCKASALFVDVRTGYIFKQAEADVQSPGIAEAWPVAEALDRKRLDAERQAMGSLLDSAGTAWVEIVRANQ